MDYHDFARVCLDPVRLSALGRAAEGTLDPEALIEGMGIKRRVALETIGELRVAGLIDEDFRIDLPSLRSIAGSLPRPAPAADVITSGDWTEEERAVLSASFTGERLREIPVNRSKRGIILERLAQEFEPGARYSEADVSSSLRRFHDDYAALRRYMVEERFMDRADGMYWRTGGRFPIEVGDDRDPELTFRGAVPDRVPRLATEDPKIVLEPFTSNHRNQLIDAANDELISSRMDDLFPHPYTGDDADRWIERCEQEDPAISFAVVVDGVVAGAIGCEPGAGTRQGCAELGWWLNPRFWGFGIGTVAARRLIRYCFEDLDQHRVEVGVALDNPASARVAEKAGMVLEGIAHDGYSIGGRIVDRISYGLIRPDTRETS